MSGSDTRTMEIPVRGMDCAACARTVEHAISRLDGVRAAEVLLSAEKAVVTIDRSAALQVDDLRRAVESAGYTVPLTGADATNDDTSRAMGRRVWWLLGTVFAVVLLVVVVGEWLRLIESITDRVPLVVGAVAVLVLGYPVLKQVVRSALRGRIISHTLMAVGALAALIAGEWATAVVVVFFMRVGDYAERFTTERARESVRSLTRMAPRKARVVRDGGEMEISIKDVRPDDVVVVRPGEQIPVDGEVVAGRATINQSAITGESMPVDVMPRSRVYAATIAELGALRVRAAAVGRDTTFGRVIRMVEEAEAHRGEIQRAADRFSAYYLPVVLLVAVSVFLLRQDLMATVAVLVVACSCAFALATPVAILASVGAAARRGLLIKGGKYLELLDRADVVLVDKTGTLTLGRPRITDIVAVNGFSEDEVLRLAASAEKYSEHPLAAAIRNAARDRGLTTSDPEEFEAFPGVGIRALIEGRAVVVGRARPAAEHSGSRAIERLEGTGKTLLSLQLDGREVGVLAAADSERAEVPEAIDALRRFGLQRLELLTGDNEMAAQAIAGPLGLSYRAGLLPDDKIEIVRRYQKEGHTVVMIGDGVNDAPALAQADVGIAMGAAGADVAIEVANIAVMRDDWLLIPDLFTIARRTMRVVRMNIGFTALYNLAGLTLAALGFLPPFLAAAAQSLPDLGILANSARLLRQ